MLNIGFMLLGFDCLFWGFGVIDLIILVMVFVKFSLFVVWYDVVFWNGFELIMFSFIDNNFDSIYLS